MLPQGKSSASKEFFTPIVHLLSLTQLTPGPKMIGLFRKRPSYGRTDWGALEKRLLTQILTLYTIPFGLLSGLAILFEVPLR